MVLFCIRSKCLYYIQNQKYLHLTPISYSISPPPGGNFFFRIYIYKISLTLPPPANMNVGSENSGFWALMITLTFSVMGLLM